MELFELTKKLIEIESISGNEQKVVDFVKDYLQKLHFHVELQEVVDARCNLYATQDDPDLILTTHFDTVAPYIPFSEDEEYIYGRGACDAKGIMAAQIKTVERLLDEGWKNIGLLFVIGEEVGSPGARAAGRMHSTSKYFINGEPTENKLAIGSKGALRVILETSGVSAHSAYPDLGDSAILKLLEVLNDLNAVEMPRDEILGETTLNIGTIQGGTQANVVPDFTKTEIMLRTVTSADEIKQLLEQTINGRADIHYAFHSDPLFLEKVDGFESTVVSFATDIPLLTNFGKPLLMGPGSIHDAHSEHERISKKQLTDAVDIYCELAKKLVEQQ